MIFYLALGGLFTVYALVSGLRCAFLSKLPSTALAARTALSLPGSDAPGPMYTSVPRYAHVPRQPTLLLFWLLHVMSRLTTLPVQAPPSRP